MPLVKNTGGSREVRFRLPRVIVFGYSGTLGFFPPRPQRASGHNTSKTKNGVVPYIGYLTSCL